MSNITLEITHSCNLSCSFCYLPKNKDLTADLKILNKLPKKIDNLLITGGEPTLHKNFEHFWRKAYGLAKFTHISTNALILEKYIKIFKDFPPKSIQISAHLYDLNAIIKKVKILQDSLPKIAIFLSYVFIPGTEQKLIKLLSSKELKNTTIKILFPIPLHNEKWWTFNEYITTLFNIINNTNIKVKFGFSNMLTTMVLKEMNNDFYGRCDALTEESFMINPAGNVFLCFFLRSETYIGNVYKNSWEELISERKKKIKEMWNPGQDCIGCKFTKQCKGGCAAIRKYYGEERCKTVKKITDSML